MLVVICFGNSLGILYAISNLILIPYLTQRLGNLSLASLVFSLGVFSSALTGPVIGFLSDKIGKRIQFISLLVLISIACALGLASSNKLLVVLSGFMMASCTFSFLTPYSALIGDNSNGENRIRNFGISIGIVNISLFATSVLISFLGRHSDNLILRGLAIVMLLVVLPVILDQKRKNRQALVRHDLVTDTCARHLVVSKYPGLIVCLLVYFFFWFAYGGMMPHLTSFLASSSMGSIYAASKWIGILTLVSGMSGVITGKAVNLLGQRSLFLISCSLLVLVCGGTVVGYNALVSNKSFSLLWLIWVLGFGTASGFLSSLISSLLSSLVDKNEQGRVFGIANAVNVCSQSLSVWLMGYVISQRGYKSMFLISSLVFCIVCLLSILFFFTVRQRDVR
ncbi:MAG TPA: MFS transporter [Pseudothermotoga sp.]|nr:MFS transporter [Pseudothermotoga sp.]HOK83157.1 MFS transporter [Pseudothermotoga sp.]HPP69672.1 MFS transporter [Pseudothermotoga sp.]